MYNGIPNNNPSLLGRNITRSFGSGETKMYALRDVSIDMYPGQISLLMGPSGSGKSTLLAALSGLLKPDSGEVICMDEDLWAMSERQREAFRLKNFGFIFQGYNLFPALTARQQLEMVLRWGNGTNAREARKRAEEMLEKLNLQRKGHLRPAQLSGGEKQRVAIGRALIKDPQFCFADEPTSALDWEHGKQVVELLRDAAHDNNATIMVVAHDARIISHVDRVFHMEDGKMVEAGHEMILEHHFPGNSHSGEPKLRRAVGAPDS